MLPAEKCDIILVAGGRGSRYKSEIPKQFEIIQGRPLYLWSLDVFLNWELTDNVVVVVPQDWVDPVCESFKILNNPKIKVVAGGESRQESASLGVNTLRGSFCDWVMIHDAARPAVSEDLLNRLWGARKSAQASEDIAGVVPGVLARETIKKVKSAIPFDVITETLERESLRVIQTPQLLKRDLLEMAYKQCEGDEAVDDSSLLEKLGHKCVVVNGDYDNVKVTFNEDRERVSDWLRNRRPPL